MADYRAMYHKLFNRISDVIELLQTVQLETESMYLEADAPTVHIFDSKDENNIDNEEKEPKNE